ncbi:tetratricopeptide repeat protein [Campylobacter troglodytis]|uniref:tetratricopeptide repeat protein n=1 Tax=Campylobacter troglodytis TaxID=654363 RepID=UPI0011592C2E|nr:tetratricopeptide repeat protein [Campylobacter troglodytis]TQR54205.1 sel1 repeat family protein [Campylobacter troglodytis]
MKKSFIILAILFKFSLALSLNETVALYEAKRYELAFHNFNLLCQQNSATACFFLGLMYDQAQGVKENESEASRLYELACKKGISSACFNNALLFDKNELTEEADLNFYKACQLRHIDACRNLGLRYEERKEGSTALSFYEKACKFKDGSSCFKLAKLYEEGNLVRQNVQLATRTYRTSCELNFTLACHLLGEHYEGSDNSLAKRYYGRACDKSYEPACEAYKRVNQAQ